MYCFKYIYLYTEGERNWGGGVPLCDFYVELQSAVINGIPVKQFEHRSVKRKQIVLAPEFLFVEKEIYLLAFFESFGNTYNSQNKKC